MNTAEMTDAEVLAESARLDLAMKRASLELVQSQLTEFEEKKAQRKRRLQKAEFDLAESNRQKALREANCKHRKGGRNKEGLDKGNGSDYSVIQNTYPAGDVQVMCQRCGATWDNPSLELKATDPALYEKRLREYRRALEWPTDNEPSGTQLFLITRHEPARGRSSTDAPAKASTKSKTKAKSTERKAA
jgi:hypothetical protein